MNKKRTPIGWSLTLMAAAGLLLCGCRSLPVSSGQIESLHNAGDYEIWKENVVPYPGKMIIISDFPSEELTRQAGLWLKQLCDLHNEKRDHSDGGEKTGSPVFISVEITEQSFMKDLRLYRSISIVMTARNTSGEELARYIRCKEGRQSIESAPRLFRMLEQGFGKLVR